MSEINLHKMNLYELSGLLALDKIPIDPENKYSLENIIKDHAESWYSLLDEISDTSSNKFSSSTYNFITEIKNLIGTKNMGSYGLQIFGKPDLPHQFYEPCIPTVKNITDVKNIIQKDPLILLGIFLICLYTRTPYDIRSNFIANIAEQKNIKQYNDIYISLTLGCMFFYLDDMKNVQKNSIANLNKENEKLRQNVEKLIILLEKKLIDVEISIVETREVETELKNNVKIITSDLFEDTQFKLEAISKMYIESEKLKAAEQIWAKKINKHSCFAYIGIIIWILSIAILTYYWIPFLHLNAQINNNDTFQFYFVAASRLLPVIGAAWVLRVAIRVIQAHFVLLDDAEQRRAQLLTYLNLVRDENAKLGDAERILVLNSLFRPLPGYQNEDVSPPSISDFLSELIKGSNKK